MRKVYSILIGHAILTGNQKEAEHLTQEAMREMSQECAGIITRFSPADLPLVLASMQMMAASMKSTLSAEEVHAMDLLVKRTKCIVVDANGIRNQMDKNHEPDEE